MLIFTEIGALSDSETKLCQTCWSETYNAFGNFFGLVSAEF